jgi:hypothetical protein
MCVRRMEPVMPLYANKKCPGPEGWNRPEGWRGPCAALNAAKSKGRDKGGYGVNAP